MCTMFQSQELLSELSSIHTLWDSHRHDWAVESVLSKAMLCTLLRSAALGQQLEKLSQLVLLRQRPGMVNTPVFLTSFAATVTRLFKMLEQSLVFMSCSVAMDFNNSPFVIAFAEPDFIAFIGA